MVDYTSQIAVLQPVLQLEPEHFFIPDIIRNRHHSRDIVIQARKPELLLHIFRDPFVKIILIMRRRSVLFPGVPAARPGTGPGFPPVRRPGGPH